MSSSKFLPLKDINDIFNQIIQSEFAKAREKHKKEFKDISELPDKERRDQLLRVRRELGRINQSQPEIREILKEIQEDKQQEIQQATENKTEEDKQQEIQQAAENKTEEDKQQEIQQAAENKVEEKKQETIKLQPVVLTNEKDIVLANGLMISLMRKIKVSYDESVLSYIPFLKDSKFNDVRNSNVYSILADKFKDVSQEQQDQAEKEYNEFHKLQVESQATTANLVKNFQLSSLKKTEVTVDTSPKLKGHHFLTKLPSEKELLENKNRWKKGQKITENNVQSNIPVQKLSVFKLVHRDIRVKKPSFYEEKAAFQKNSDALHEQNAIKDPIKSSVALQENETIAVVRPRLK